MNVFGICKVAGIACGIAGGVLGAVGSVPELTSAMKELKKEDDIPEINEVVEE